MGRDWQGVGPAAWLHCPTAGRSWAQLRARAGRHPSSTLSGFQSILSPVPASRRKARQNSCSHFSEERMKPQRGEVTHVRPRAGASTGEDPLQCTASQPTLLAWEGRGRTSLCSHSTCPSIDPNTLISLHSGG